MSKSQRSVVPYASEYGTVNPGDLVYVVTKCTGTVRTQRGTYLGLSRGGGVQVRVDITRAVTYYKGTDTKADWSVYYNSRVKPELDVRLEPRGQRITTLINNTILPVKGN